MELPQCEQHQAGRCPKSDTYLLSEHGTNGAIWYWTFACRTCKVMFMKWNPAVVEAAKKQALDREIGSLMGGAQRFKGMETPGGKV